MPYSPLTGKNTVNDIVDRLNSVSVDVENAGSGNTQGPESSVVGNVPSFVDTTGKLLNGGYPVQTSGSDTTAGSILRQGATKATLGADVAGTASPTFTGTPAAPTAAPGTNTTQIATTAFVKAADDLKANIASPTFTGTPAVPTATAGANTTQIASTAFVFNAVGIKENTVALGIASAATTNIGVAKVAGSNTTGDVFTITGSTTITSFGTAVQAGVTRTLIIANGLTITHGASTIICPDATNMVVPAGSIIEVVCVNPTTPTWRVTAFQRSDINIAEVGYLNGVVSDIQPQLDLKAPLESPALTGVPVSTTAAPGTSSTQIATCSFVTSADDLKANIASPTFTGTPAAPTASPGTNTTQLATTAFVKAADDLKINSSLLGVANGVATLDSGGKVPTAQLPAYVDDVLEFANLAGFPGTGETGKIYVALDTNKTYRWSGSAYVYITSGAVDSVAGKTGVVTLVKADVGLGSVDNTADTAKPVSTAQQTALNLKADLAGPTFTGVPSAPTATPGTNTTQIATTAFVAAAVPAVAASATKLETARLIGGVSFDGTANINLPGVNAAGNQNTSGSSASCTGNAASASAVAWSGVSSKPTTLGGYGITDALNIAGGTLTGTLAISTATPQINFVDTDWGTRFIHCNGGSIGFLTSVGAWAFQCDNSGNVIATANITAYSDIRLKTNIQVIPDALNKVCTLRGVTYDRIETGERQTGVIAQELQAVLPEAVMVGKDENETLSVAYGNLVGLLIEAIKELKAEIDILKGEK